MMDWKAPWWKRILNFLVWKPRHFIYRLLGLPDEIEESIGGLNWAISQNAARLSRIEGFLILDGEYETLDLARGLAEAAAERATISADELFQKILDDCGRQQEFLERVHDSLNRSLTIPNLTDGQKRDAVLRTILDDVDWSES